MKKLIFFFTSLALCGYSPFSIFWKWSWCEVKAQSFQWANAIGSLGSDAGYSIATDASGNVFITGYFYGTTDFDPGTGSATLTSQGLEDIFFAKYDSNGNYLWAKSIGSSTGSDYGNSIATDASGNVYITGSIAGIADFDPGVGSSILTSQGFYDIFFAKYDANGNYLWAKIIGTTIHGAGYSIATDASGYVYFTGFFNDTANFVQGTDSVMLISKGFADIFFAKYDGNGNYLWAKSIGSSDYDYGSSTAIDTSGNVYITGYFESTTDFDPGFNSATLTSQGMHDIFFAKYDVNGNYLWAKSIGSTSRDISFSIATDASANVLITGYFSETADFDPAAGSSKLTSQGWYDIFLAKYDANGNYLWAKSIGGAGSDIGNSITLNASGNVYITGYFTDTVDFDPGVGSAMLASKRYADIFIAKYDAKGNYVWAKSIGSKAEEDTYGIATDASGNIYITGNFNSTIDFDPDTGSATLTTKGEYDIFFAKYSAKIDGIDELIRVPFVVTLYPNPTSGIFTIECQIDDIKFQIPNVSVYNLIGKVIYQSNYQKRDKSTNTIDLSIWPAGIYLIKVVMEGVGVYVGKIVKE